MAEIRHLENWHDVIFICRGWSDLDTISQAGTEWHVDCGDVWKWKPDGEFQYGGRLGEFNGMSFQSHVWHCRVLPLGEFTVTIPEPHAALQGVRIPSAILKIVLGHILFFICNAVKALTNGGFALVSSPIDLFVTAVSAQCGAMWHVNFHKHVSDASLNDTVLVPVTGSWLLRHTRPIPRHTTTTTFVTVFEKKNNELRTASETAEIKLWWSSRYYL